MLHTATSLADLDKKVKELAGDHYDTLMSEFVSYEDLRVGTLREIRDLGVPREVAENVLYYLQCVDRGMFPSSIQCIDLVAGPMEPMDEEAILTDEQMATAEKLEKEVLAAV